MDWTVQTMSPMISFMENPNSEPRTTALSNRFIRVNSSLPMYTFTNLHKVHVKSPMLGMRLTVKIKYQHVQGPWIPPASGSDHELFLDLGAIIFHKAGDW